MNLDLDEQVTIPPKDQQVINTTAADPLESTVDSVDFEDFDKEMGFDDRKTSVNHPIVHMLQKQQQQKSSSDVPYKWKVIDQFGRVLGNEDEVGKEEEEDQAVSVWLENLVVKYEELWKAENLNFAASGDESVDRVLTQSLSRISRLHGVEEDASGQLWDILRDLFVRMKKFQRYEDDSIANVIRKLKYVLQIAGEHCGSLDRSQVFDQWIDVSKQIFPTHCDLFELLRFSKIAHHDKSQANIVIRRFVEMYQRNANLDSEYCRDIAAQAIIKLHFYLGTHSHISPLTCGILKDESIWESADPNYEWLEIAINQSVYPEEKLKKFSKIVGNLELEKVVWELAGSVAKRMAIIQNYLEILPKDSATHWEAYLILAHHKFHQSNESVEVEEILFNLLKIMDSQKTEIILLSPILSELTIQSLITFGEVLLVNKKKRLAILAFEGACLGYKLRYGEDYYSMFKKLADICDERSDWNRALFYYESVLKFSQNGRNMNEIVYISLQICKICVEIADLSRAEDALLAALKFIMTLYCSKVENLEDDTAIASPERKIAEEQVRAPRLSIMNRLAQLYLEADRLDDAIRIYRQIISSGIAKGKTSNIKLLLVKCLLKRRLYGVASEILSEIELQVEENQSISHSKRQSRGSINPNASFATTSSEIIRSLDYVDLKIRCLIGELDLSNALTEISYFFKKFGANNFRAIAKLHDLKAKVLLQKINQNLEILSYESISDILLSDYREYVNACSAAHEYYVKINETFRASKALIYIAEAFLGFLFPACVLNNKSFKYINQWLLSCGFQITENSTENEMKESLRRVEIPLKNALDLLSKSCDINLLLRAYISMSELKLLQGEKDASVIFWKECRNLFFSSYMNGDSFMFFKDVRSSFLDRCERVFKRIVRILLMFDYQIIESNLLVLDSFLAFQSETTKLRDSIRLTDEDDDSIGSSGSIGGSGVASDSTDDASRSSSPPASIKLSENRSRSSSKSSSVISTSSLKISKTKSNFFKRFSLFTTKHVSRSPHKSISSVFLHSLLPGKKFYRFDEDSPMYKDFLILKALNSSTLISKTWKKCDTGLISAEQAEKLSKSFLNSFLQYVNGARQSGEIEKRLSELKQADPLSKSKQYEIDLDNFCFTINPKEKTVKYSPCKSNISNHE